MLKKYIILSCLFIKHSSSYCSDCQIAIRKAAILFFANCKQAPVDIDVCKKTVQENLALLTQACAHASDADKLLAKKIASTIVCLFILLNASFTSL